MRCECRVLLLLFNCVRPLQQEAGRAWLPAFCVFCFFFIFLFSSFREVFDCAPVVFHSRAAISAECRYEWQSLSNHFKDCDYSALNLASLHIWLLANLNPRARWAVRLHHHLLSSPPIAFAMTNPIRKICIGHTAKEKRGRGCRNVF